MDKLALIVIKFCWISVFCVIKNAKHIPFNANVPNDKRWIIVPAAHKSFNYKICIPRNGNAPTATRYILHIYGT